MFHKSPSSPLLALLNRLNSNNNNNIIVVGIQGPRHGFELISQAEIMARAE